MGAFMAVSDHVDLATFIEGVKRRNPGQPEFAQAVQEVAEDIYDYIQDKEQYHKYQILRRIAEPDRVIVAAKAQHVTERAIGQPIGKHFLGVTIVLDATGITL